MLLGILLLISALRAAASASAGAGEHLRRQSAPVNASAKAGLAWANGNWHNVRQYTFTGKVSWYYTWSVNPVRTDIEFVPMLWGERQTSQFAANINRTISRNKVTHVLGMNEPQQRDQANMSPEDGATMWTTYLEPLKAQGIRLGTPSPSSAPSGKTWLEQWRAACAGRCNPDFVALHWYGTNADRFIAYLWDFYYAFGLPIWVTEWACQDFSNGPQCTQQQVVDFLNATQSFMDSTDWVERYSWFGVMQNLQGVNQDNAMMDSRGEITPLGEQYIGARPGERPVGAARTNAISVVLLLITMLCCLLLHAY